MDVKIRGGDDISSTSTLLAEESVSELQSEPSSMPSSIEESSSKALVESEPQKPQSSSVPKVASSAPVVTSSAPIVTSSVPQHTECSHTFSVNTQNPTCTNDGVETQVCTKCFIEVRNVIKATGHNMSDGKCTACGYADVTVCRNKVSDWLQTNYSGKYTLSDSRYYIKTAGGGNIFFYLDDAINGTIIISIYGWEKNLCYIEYIKNENIEGEFPMDSVHSTNRIYFNQMNGTASGNQKTEMITELRGKIDGMLLEFQKVMSSNIGISLKDIGFTSY